jgi:endonuclease/exonuclease/phosphatase family metal-dependent hydrolase
MRLVSYNILDGGEGRADPLAEVIEAQRPDIVALVEAENHAVVERISRRLKMECVEAVGNRHGAALLSRWPIVESVNHSLLREGFSDAFLQATVHDASGRDWIVGVTHLHPRAGAADDLVRQGEVAMILEILAEERKANTPHLLAGDFNSDSPVQNIDPATCKPATQKAWVANGNCLPRGAVQKLLEAGYVDTLHALHPKEAADVGSFTTQFPGQRLDYVFAFGFGDRLKKAWIEQDRLAKYASDHFPVGVEIE